MKQKRIFLLKLLSAILLPAILLPVVLVSCRKPDDEKSVVLNSKQSKIYAQLTNSKSHRLSSYDFNSNSTVVSRVADAPDFVLKYISDMDGRDYTIYTPTADELKLIEQSISRLPPLHQKILKSRLVGMYFINNFWGSGMADLVIADNDDVYGMMFFNSAVLKHNISDWLTYKEYTCFHTNSSDGYTIRFDCGTNNNAFMYILIHESTHIVDYVVGITPYVDTVHRLHKVVSKQEIPETTEFIDGIWKSYKRPVNNFTLRKKITFYGFSKGPKLHITNSFTIYEQLAESDFVSLYGSMVWAEDLAEFTTFYHLTQKLGLPYTINVYKDDETVFSLKPMENSKVRKRFKEMDVFYR